jgi:pyrimidine operon attenuation protein / uracil phosphoribosyltransferase
MPERLLMTEDDLRRALVRIAHEIVEAHRGAQDLVLVGMRTRGVPLARRLAASIEEIEGGKVPVGTLDIGLYRDDLPSRGVAVEIAPSDIPTDLNGKRVVLVDDVLYTGRSIRAALDALMDFGRPQRIQLAVLVDRGHRELPIRPDYVGKNLPTTRKDDIQVRLLECDGRDEVAVVTGEE